ncbi:MAG: heme ABC exporter ATP-binding protein CcmA [Acidobacteriia bacterium]|nr:heme ABC exporter ATP-binding protein CcmA [Terriglobia bacterium]
MPESAPHVGLTDIHKSFGHFTALDRVACSVASGEVVALFGRNGAGKTTLLKILALLMRPTSGDYQLQGESARRRPDRTRAQIGFISHSTYLYADLTAFENLNFFGTLYDLSDREDRIQRALNDVKLWDRRNERVRGFSRGMQQRLSLARTFLHNPSLLLLDEPYTGLDPIATDMLDRLIERCQGEGRTVILTTHNLDLRLRVVSHVLVLEKGNVVFDERGTGFSPKQFTEIFRAHVDEADE